MSVYIKKASMVEKTVKNKKNVILSRMYKHRAMYFMILPAIIFYVIFSYVPMYGLTIAFKDFYSKRGILGSPWVGLYNFRQIFTDPYFWQVLKNTLIINVMKLGFAFPAPIILTLMFNEVRSKRFSKTIQTIVYLPHFISWVVISGIIFSLLSGDGLINSILIAMGRTKIDFLTNKELFRPLLVISEIWKETGWDTIVYLAAITGISPELYEAAKIDGANRLRQLLNITIPCLLPTVSVMLILKTGGLMNGGFDQVFNLYNPIVYPVGDVIDTYVYRLGIGQSEYSLSTAVGLFLSISNFIMLVSVNFITKKISGNGIY